VQFVTGIYDVQSLYIGNHCPVSETISFAIAVAMMVKEIIKLGKLTTALNNKQHFIQLYRNTPHDMFSPNM
jgi:hypothetical protein